MRAAFWSGTIYGQTYSIWGCTYRPPSQALLLCGKALSVLRVHSAAEFCKKTQNWLTQLEQLLRSTEANPDLPPSLWGQPFRFLQDRANSTGWTTKKGANLPPSTSPQTCAVPWRAQDGTGLWGCSPKHPLLDKRRRGASSWQSPLVPLELRTWVDAGRGGRRGGGGEGGFVRHRWPRAQQAEHQELLSSMGRAGARQVRNVR